MEKINTQAIPQPFQQTKRLQLMNTLVPQFEEPRVKYEGEKFDEDLFKTWVFVHSMPTIVEFSHETASKIFGGQIKYHLLLFLSKVSSYPFLYVCKRILMFLVKTLTISINYQVEETTKKVLRGLRKTDTTNFQAQLLNL